MDTIDQLLTRGVANIIPDKTTVDTVLRSNSKLNVYCGFDVTAPQLHLGNTVPLRKLQQFIDLGHHVTFLIGDFTTLVGDTSDKETERPVLSDADIDANWRHYSSQAGKIIDLDKVAVVRNSQWLDQLSLREFITLSRRFSLNDFISRELIKTRLSSGNSVNLSEVLYPVLQGFDSLHLDTDIQVGATDQTFNMQAGRTLLKQLKGKDSYVISFAFLPGTDGRKMSKSWGNAIWLTDSPANMYGKVMSLKDDLIITYFTLATNTPDTQLIELNARLKSGENPMNIKKELARVIVTELHSSDSAQQAADQFAATIQHHTLPTTIPEVSVPSSHRNTIIDTLVFSHLSPSKSAAKRLIDQHGVKLNQKTITDSNTPVSTNDIISIGKLKFIRIID